VLAPTMLDEAVDGARRSVDPRGAVCVDVAADLPPVVADGVLLERSLANLLANALRYNPDDHRPVRVDAAAIGDAVNVRVVDHGPGIAADQRRRVLAPFQRVGDDRDGTGVGLGLAIANGFVEAMGATLALDETPGGGLTATVSLRVFHEERTCPAS
jgi:two-component system, OmpR family, sensor histidine kinase KdpD